ncbi:MAG: phosphocholine cytidylyltransferase family protein [Sandaracinaceae bacterium]|jgi:choline kinase|nr:phosphocholine cytidylyltransferase family protein [Sandaracinaceae bacterium]
MKRAIILAAGRGSRLGDASGGTPKCLLTVGGKTLIEHQLAVLHEARVKSITIVVGYAADQIMRHLGADYDYVLNERFAETNSLYSLWLARRPVEGSVTVINSDVFADPIIYHRVLAARGNVLAFDSASGNDDEHMKVNFDGNQLRAISKTMPAVMSHGENLGILRFNKRGARSLFAEASRLIASGAHNAWAPAALDRVAKDVPIHGIDVRGLPWTEIDFPEDLVRAEKKVWPAIAAERNHHIFAQRTGAASVVPFSRTANR